MSTTSSSCLSAAFLPPELCGILAKQFLPRAHTESDNGARMAESRQPWPNQDNVRRTTMWEEPKQGDDKRAPPFPPLDNPETYNLFLPENAEEEEKVEAKPIALPQDIVRLIQQQYLPPAFPPHELRLPRVRVIYHFVQRDPTTQAVIGVNIKRHIFPQRNKRSSSSVGRGRGRGRCAVGTGFLDLLYMETQTEIRWYSLVYRDHCKMDWK